MLSDLKLSQRLQAVKFPRVSGFAKIDWRPKYRGLSVALVSWTAGMTDTAVCFIYVQYRCHRATDTICCNSKNSSLGILHLNLSVSERFQYFRPV
jgi:hypothetical protein